MIMMSLRLMPSVSSVAASRAGIGFGMGWTLILAFAALLPFSAARGQGVEVVEPKVDPVADPDGLRAEVRSYLVDSLKTVPVPLPTTITEYVKDQRAAVALGKALFWDQQAGSDGMACASCHFHAGADSRVKNQLSPGLIGGNGTFEKLPSGSKAGGPNYTLTRADFPLHKKVDSKKHDLGSNVQFDTDDVVSSSGVAFAEIKNLGPQVVRSPKTAAVTQDLVTNRANAAAGIVPSSATNATIVPNAAKRPTRTNVAELFNLGKADPLGFFITVGGKKMNTRRVEPRNTPTVINSVYTHRNFWDGRANFHFNGRNPFGPRDPNAKVWKYAGARLSSVSILLDNASLASQAVGPVESVLEMSAHNRNFLHVGRKLLLSTPLLTQMVAASDSVLGPYSRSIPTATRTGLKVGYGDLIKQAFANQWWEAPGDPIVIDGVAYSQMEANFSLYWGIAIMLYERTLISDETPFDRFMEGDNTALSAVQRTGLSLFLHEGKCANCHAGPEFTGASISHLKNSSGSTKYQLVERMQNRSSPAIYDSGFYNINVRPALEDDGVGGKDPFGNPLSFSAQATDAGRTVDVSPPFADPSKFEVGSGRPPAPGEPIAVVGAFKTPSLRNIDLTGPYFHNGGYLTLEQVVQFYARGTDFVDWNRAHGFETDPDVSVIPEINGDREKVRAVAAFMRSLTDPRVAYERAPFDHPSLRLPNGHLTTADPVVPGAMRSAFIDKPAVGAAGNPTPIQPFLGGSHVGPNGVPGDDGLN